MGSSPSHGTQVSVILPELSALMQQLDLLLKRDAPIPQVTVNVPPYKEPVFNIQVPEYPAPVVHVEAPQVNTPPVNVDVNPNLRIEMVLAKPWQIYSLIFGVYVLIFLLSWNVLPSVY